MARDKCARKGNHGRGSSDGRVTIATDDEESALLRAAADVSNLPVSVIVRRAAVKEAKRVLSRNGLLEETFARIKSTLSHRRRDATDSQSTVHQTVDASAS